MNYNVKFTVSLNNGETLYENKGILVETEGGLSSWNKLQTYLKDNNLYITSLSLMTDAGQRWNLPSFSNNPKFKAFSDAIKPNEFSFERVAGLDWDDKENIEVFTTINIYFNINDERHKLSTWVSEKNTNNSWSLLVKQNG